MIGILVNSLLNEKEHLPHFCQLPTMFADSVFVYCERPFWLDALVDRAIFVLGYEIFKAIKDGIRLRKYVNRTAPEPT